MGGFNLLLTNVQFTSSSLASTTIQDYCISGTSMVLFMVGDICKACFTNAGLELAIVEG
jgi:hypothetical protein